MNMASVFILGKILSQLKKNQTEQMKNNNLKTQILNNIWT